MKQKITLLIILFSIMYSTITIFAQSSDETAMNTYEQWMDLSLKGKNQSEIEYFFRKIKPESLEKVKERLRKSVIYNLKIKNLEQKINHIYDLDDIYVLKNIINSEIRFVSLEMDETLKIKINEEFGFNLTNLSYRP